MFQHQELSTSTSISNPVSSTAPPAAWLRPHFYHLFYFIHDQNQTCITVILISTTVVLTAQFCLELLEVSEDGSRRHCHHQFLKQLSNATTWREQKLSVLTTSFGLLLAGTTPAKHRHKDRESMNDLQVLVPSTDQDTKSVGLKDRVLGPACPLLSSPLLPQQLSSMSVDSLSSCLTLTTGLFPLLSPLSSS